MSARRIRGYCGPCQFSVFAHTTASPQASPPEPSSCGSAKALPRGNSPHSTSPAVNSTVQGSVRSSIMSAQDHPCTHHAKLILSRVGSTFLEFPPRVRPTCLGAETANLLPQIPDNLSHALQAALHFLHFAPQGWNPGFVSGISVAPSRCLLLAHAFVGHPLPLPLLVSLPRVRLATKSWLCRSIGCIHARPELSQLPADSVKCSSHALEPTLCTLDSQPNPRQLFPERPDLAAHGAYILFRCPGASGHTLRPQRQSQGLLAYMVDLLAYLLRVGHVLKALLHILQAGVELCNVVLHEASLVLHVTTQCRDLLAEIVKALLQVLF
mmetsp:Transcript_6807/g.18843  ORF Transcript_6807/g.18843 Transcript_6807/m.18843 type:complete len:325 (+) Transcript_6807:212-1186(+)